MSRLIRRKSSAAKIGDSKLANEYGVIVKALADGGSIVAGKVQGKAKFINLTPKQTQSPKNGFLYQTVPEILH